MNKEIVSKDGKFSVIPSDRTITKEEIPALILDAGKILTNLVFLYRGIIAKDPVTIGKTIVDIYDALLDIKKMVED